MKRAVFFLTTIFAAALFAGCGKLNDQEPAAKDPGTATNKVAGMDMPQAPATSSQPGGFVAHDGSVYEGEMKDGKPDGRGTLTDARGTYQKGEWRNGVLYRASGTCVFPDGTKEEGTWNNDGSKSGGTISWPDGRTYKGDWVVVDGQPDLPYGMGTMTWPDGREYAGHFANGKMDGAGKMTYPDGKVEDGAWKDNAFQGAAK